MFDTKESVNQVLNYSKILLDQMNQGKNYCGKFKEMQYLIFAGMISYYGFDYIKEIYEAFEKTEFTYTNRHMNDILASIGCTKLPPIGYDMPAFFNKRIFFLNSGNFVVKKDVIISTAYDLTPIDLLECTAHECNHIVNSVNKEIFNKNDMSVIRFGMNVDGLSRSYNEGRLLEESINVLQTAEIMNEILKFSHFDIEDPVIANALNNIKYANNTKREGRGYEFVVPLIKPLYNNYNFNRIAKEARISGDIEKIDWEFDRKVGKNKFSELKQNTDNIEDESAFYSPSHAKVKTLVYSYLNN